MLSIIKNPNNFRWSRGSGDISMDTGTCVLVCLSCYNKILYITKLGTYKQ